MQILSTKYVEEYTKVVSEASEIISTLFVIILEHEYIVFKVD